MEKLSKSINQITEVIQEHVEGLLEHNSEAENQIINWLLQCLDLLYSNFPEKDANTMKVREGIHLPLQF